MDLIKVLNSAPIVTERGSIVDYERIIIRYEKGEWKFIIILDGEAYDINTTDDDTVIEVGSELDG